MAPTTTAPVFAIFGLGRAGHFHLTNVTTLHNVRLKWVMDINKELADRIAKQYGAQACYDVETIVNDPEVNAVVVSSATYAHFEQIKASLKAGKAVFTEKPISFNENELKEIIEYAIECKVPFFVGYQRRIDHNFASMREMVNQGKIGQVRILRSSSRDNPRPPSAYLQISGGMFHDMLCHDIDMHHFITNEIPESVYTVAHAYEDEFKAMDDVDTVISTFYYSSGLIATIDASRISAHGYDQRVEVFGEDGMIQVENEKVNTVHLATKDGYLSAVNEFSFPQRYVRTYRRELEHFIQMVATWTPESDEDLRRHILLERVTTAAEWSWKRRRVVKISEVDEERNAKK